MDETNGAFGRLVRIMDELREQCPWDRKQTIGTLRPLTIEETYELADAITEGNWKGIKEELGDLLLHIVFYARIGGEQGKFTLEEVINGICDKLISRHPHVYSTTAQQGLVAVKNEEDVKRNWEQLKLKEGKKSVLGGVPVSLPAVIKAMRLQEKAGKVGFEWEETAQVWEKVIEELGELQEAIGARDSRKVDVEDAGSVGGEEGAQFGVEAIGKIEEEFGDLMFSMVNYARFLHIDAENALERTNRKFIHRFTRMEEEARAQGRSLADMSLPEMDGLWSDVKARDAAEAATRATSGVAYKQQKTTD
jgi:XTP/dITP diphosphohydrolase